MIILLCFSLGGTAFSILSSYVGHLEWNTLFSHVSRHSNNSYSLGFQTRGMRIVATYSHIQRWQNYKVPRPDPPLFSSTPSTSRRSSHAGPFISLSPPSRWSPYTGSSTVVPHPSHTTTAGHPARFCCRREALSAAEALAPWSQAPFADRFLRSLLGGVWARVRPTMRVPVRVTVLRQVSRGPPCGGVLSLYALRGSLGFSRRVHSTPGSRLDWSWSLHHLWIIMINLT